MEATEHLKTAANAARAATHVLARSSETTRNTALAAMADALRDGMRDILAANRQDVGAYRGTAAIRRPPHPDRGSGRSDGAGVGGSCGAAGPPAAHAGRLDPAERAAHPTDRRPQLA